MAAAYSFSLTYLSGASDPLDLTSQANGGAFVLPRTAADDTEAGKLKFTINISDKACVGATACGDGRYLVTGATALPWFDSVDYPALAPDNSAWPAEGPGTASVGALVAFTFVGEPAAPTGVAGVDSTTATTELTISFDRPEADNAQVGQVEGGMLGCRGVLWSRLPPAAAGLPLGALWPALHFPPLPPCIPLPLTAAACLPSLPPSPPCPQSWLVEVEEYWPGDQLHTLAPGAGGCSYEVSNPTATDSQATFTDDVATRSITLSGCQAGFDGGKFRVTSFKARSFWYEPGSDSFTQEVAADLTGAQYFYVGGCQAGLAGLGGMGLLGWQKEGNVCGCGGVPARIPAPVPFPAALALSLSAIEPPPAPSARRPRGCQPHGGCCRRV